MTGPSPGLLAARSGDLVRHIQTGILMGIASRYGAPRRNTVVCLWPNIFGSWRSKEFDIGELAVVKRGRPYDEFLNITPVDVWDQMITALEEVCE